MKTIKFSKRSLVSYLKLTSMCEANTERSRKNGSQPDWDAEDMLVEAKAKKQSLPAVR